MAMYERLNGELINGLKQREPTKALSKKLKSLLDNGH